MPHGQDSTIERNCLALNIYFEARGEPLLGKIAVGQVVMNRVRDPRYPQSPCAVVRQGGERVRYRCQFTWWCDGLSDTPRNRKVWKESLYIADLIYRGVLADPTAGALWYHAVYVEPAWSKRLVKRANIGQHLFYIDPSAASETGEPQAAARCLPAPGAGWMGAGRMTPRGPSSRA